VEGRCVKTYQGHRNEKYSIGVCFGTYTADASGNEQKTNGNEQKANGDEQKDRGDEQPKQWALAACGSEDGSTVLWDVNSKEVLQRLQGHEGVVLGVDVCAQDGAVATCGIDKTIKIYRRRRQAAPTVNGQASSGAEEEGGGVVAAAQMVEGTGPAPETGTSQPTPTDIAMEEV
jgi:COMPASS component SWD3